MVQREFSSGSASVTIKALVARVKTPQLEQREGVNVLDMAEDWKNDPGMVLDELHRANDD